MMFDLDSGPLSKMIRKILDKEEKKVIIESKDLNSELTESELNDVIKSHIKGV